MEPILRSNLMQMYGSFEGCPINSAVSWLVISNNIIMTHVLSTEPEFICVF